MASDEDNHGSSPMHLGLTGQFSPEDIQELLGVMGDGSDAHHHQGSDGDGGASGSDGYTHVSGNSYGDSNAAPAPAPASSGSDGGVASAGGLSSSGNQTSTTSSSASGQACLPIEDDVKAQARSERKRSREKQRRSDVNKQFADLTQLLQRIDAENISEEDVKNGSANRMTFNPSNRVDLIARTIVLLERLHEANKRRRTEISSLQQQLEEAKKAGEDTAAKLKEAMLAPPGQPMNKQFMMMVPMMMSTDGSGAAVPMMNPYMPHGAMPQPYYPMPHQLTPQNVAHPAQPVPAPAAPAPSQAPAPQPVATAVPPVAAPPVAAAASAHAAHAQQQIQAAPHPAVQAQPFPYMMPPHMPGGGFMMPMASPGHVMPGQPMQPMTVQPGTSQETQNGQQEQKDSSNGLSGGSNLAHCA